MTDKPPSWLSKRGGELYEHRRLLTESRVWSGSKKFVSDRWEGQYEHRKFVTEKSKKFWYWRSVLLHIILWNIIAFAALRSFKLYIVKEYMTEEAQKEVIGVVGSGPWEVFFSIFGIIYAIIVGMLIVEALGRYNNLRSLIEQELNAIQDIRDFLTYLDDNEARLGVRSALRTYVKSVVKREWQEMKNKPEKRDSDTSKELYQLMEAVKRINANKGAGGIALESIINKVAEVTTYRTNRYMCSIDYITLPMRLLILSLSIAIGVGLITMFIPDWLQILMILACTTAMAALYQLISDLNCPFAEGELWTIKSESFENLEERLASVEVNYDDFSQQQPITEEIHVSVGDWFKVKLRNPSVDPRWSEIASIGDQSVVQQTKYDFVPPAPGTTDQEIWTFTALEKGETSVAVAWSQPGESSVKAERTFTLKVVVK